MCATYCSSSVLILLHVCENVQAFYHTHAAFVLQLKERGLWNGVWLSQVRSLLALLAEPGVGGRVGACVYSRISDACGRIRTYAVCGRMQYADVCGRMQYADVCGRMRQVSAGALERVSTARYPTDTARLYVSLLSRPLALHAGRRYSLYLLYWCKSTNTDAATQLRRGVFGGRASVDAPALA